MRGDMPELRISGWMMRARKIAERFGSLTAEVFRSGQEVVQISKPIEIHPPSSKFFAITHSASRTPITLPTQTKEDIPSLPPSQRPLPNTDTAYTHHLRLFKTPHASARQLIPSNQQPKILSTQQKTYLPPGKPKDEEHTVIEPLPKYQPRTLTVAVRTRWEVKEGTPRKPQKDLETLPEQVACPDYDRLVSGRRGGGQT